MTAPNSFFILATALGAVGMWLLLPRGAAKGRLAGAALMAVALGMWGLRMPLLPDWLSNGMFFVVAGVTVVAAVATICMRNPVYAALWFGLTLVGTAGLFLLAGAQFLAVATVVVYAGAILVTFLFVLMLAQPEGRAWYDRASWEAMVSAITGIVIVGLLSMCTSIVLLGEDAGGDPAANIAADMVGDRQAPTGVLAEEHVAEFGTELFGRHLLSVEVAGTLLLAALVGAAAIVARPTNTEQGAEH